MNVLGTILEIPIMIKVVIGAINPFSGPENPMHSVELFTRRPILFDIDTE